MSLESATYVSDLVVSNPAPTDLLEQADDHIRLLKSVLKATFPNITGPVTAAQGQLNTQFPVGGIVVWYGADTAVPTGWAICNGQTVNKTDGSGTIVLPDLRDRVVIGAGTVAAQGSTAGAATSGGTTDAQGVHTHAVTEGNHTHTFTTDGHQLTIDEIPSHTHLTVNSGVSATNLGANASIAFARNDLGASNYALTGVSGTPDSGISGPTGGNKSHTHTGTTSASNASGTTDAQGSHSHTVSGVSTLQPSLGLHYIMKV